MAKANALSNQIDTLSQQYDALKIQLDAGAAGGQIARQTAQRDQLALEQRARRRWPRSPPRAT